MCFLLKYNSWKLQLESWNTNPKSLNRTLGTKGTRGEENEEWAQWAKKKKKYIKSTENQKFKHRKRKQKIKTTKQRHPGIRPK